MKDDLHAQCGTSAAPIDRARSELKAQQARHDGHHLTVCKREARYNHVENGPKGKIRDLAEQGHRVSDLVVSLL